MAVFDADVLVVGLGAVGSAALHHVVSRGATAIGIEQFGRGHTHGSHHGHTRVYRHAYFEHPDYVPLLLESTAMVRALEAATGTPLLDECGCLVWGASDSTVVHQSAASADRYGIATERLDTAQLRERYPWFRVPDGSVGLLEPGAGFIRSVAAIRAHLERAEALGATVHTDCRVDGWDEDGAGIRVQTGVGPLRARALVLAVGAWTAHVVPTLAPLLTVTRQVQGWVNHPQATPERLPCWLVDRPGHPPLYGIPTDPLGPRGVGSKIAVHGSSQVVSADGPRMPVTQAEAEALGTARDATIPGLTGSVDPVRSCLYTVTPDEHFLLGAVPHQRRVWLAAGLSGHGFKLAPALGAALADFALTGASTRPVGFLSPERFGR